MIEQLDTNIEILHIDEQKHYGKFALYPLERGYGTTIGNSLRRVLLSSLPGSAVSKILIEGVLHEFSTINGVVEDVPEIILNIKNLSIRKHNHDKSTIFIDVQGPKIIKAEDIKVGPEIDIVNKDMHIATVNENGKLYMTMDVIDGKGYDISDQNKDENDSIGTIAIDSSFTPVKKVNFFVEDTRVGHITDYDKLIIEVWTNGTITPNEALSKGAEILINDFSYFKKLPDMTMQSEEVEEVVVEEQQQVVDQSKKEVLDRTIEELDLTLRSFNCLKRAGYNTVNDIISVGEVELRRIKNFGKKSLDEVLAKIQSLGLEFKSEQ